MQHEEMIKILVEAIAHHKAGRIAEAEPLYRQVLEYSPQTPTALQNLALILSKMGKRDEAIEFLRKSIEIEPNIALFHRNIGSVYRGAERNQEAVEALRRAVNLAPADGLCWADLGVSLDRAGYLVEAMAVYEKAIRLLTPIVTPAQPADPMPIDGSPTMELGRAHYNLGCTWSRLNNIPGAMTEYENSLRILPNFPEAHRNRAGVLFSRGQMAEAWVEYEWRWRCEDYPGKFPDFRQPRWDGSDLSDKTILIWWEQGFGDTIQFCRYAPLLSARGARVVLLCQNEMRRLLQTLNGPAEIVVSGEKKVTFDTHASLMSLPALFKTSLETIPPGTAYLHADPKDSAAWENRLAGDGPGLRVGLVWAGAAAHKQDLQRSIPLAAFAPILRIPNVQFYTLQLGGPNKQLQNLPAGRVVDHTAYIKDFADSAAFIDRLDVLITVDTAPAHLGGAIGKETWLLLPFEPEFRWMNDTENPSRWYPTVRLFRQTSPGDWKSVIERVAKEVVLRTEC